MFIGSLSFLSEELLPDKYFKNIKKNNIIKPGK
jgi:hypothetical protein